jgi:glutathione synthase
MKFAILMNELSTLKLEKDTSLAFFTRAQSLGWDSVFFTQKDMFYQDGMVMTQTYTIHVLDDALQARPLNVEALSAFDIILMRQDPPFDLEYIYATYMLEWAEQQGVLVANSPQSLRDANEKMFACCAPQCCPPTIISKNSAHIRAFWQQHRDIIIKPLNGMGGRSIFRVKEDDPNVSVILESMMQADTVSVMAQRYVPEITSTGDKRILLINGEPVPYALARFPHQGETRGNLAAGGHGVVVPITEHDRFICQEIAPFLRAKKLSFVGLDVIGDYLTEVNVTSPTCLREIEKETGLDIAGDYLRYLESLLIALKK